MSLLGALKDWKRNLAKEIYKRLEEAISDGSFEIYIPYVEDSNIFNEIIDNILPDIATELKEADLYVHYDDSADDPENDESDEFFDDEEYDYWLCIYVDSDSDDSVEPSGKKLNFDQ